MQNARLDETQTKIRISRRNISNLRYACHHHPDISGRDINNLRYS